MTIISRKSPVNFDVTPLKTEEWNDWTINTELQNETSEFYLIDLSHVDRRDLQHHKLSDYTPAQVKIPAEPCQSVLSGKILINRMNSIQASIWNFSRDGEKLPSEDGYTDTTDATVALVMIGKAVGSLAEKLSSLDLFGIKKKAPYLIQGPFSHVPCQIVILDTDGDSSCMLLTFSRGYASAMTHAILEAGKEFNIQPAGEGKFTEWLEQKK